MSEHVITTSWQEVLLLSVCDINPGVVMPEANSGNVYDFVPMDAIDEHNGILSYSEQKPFTEVRQGKTRFQVGDILFAKITPSTENGKVALVERLNTSIGFGSTEFFVFRPGNELLSTFLWFWLRSSSIRNAAVSAMTGSSGRLRVPSSFWDTLQIPLPPLPVQRAIVTILSKADAIRRKRVQARQLVDAILPALYEDIFGDPGQNRRGFPIAHLGTLGEIVSGVTKGQKIRGGHIVEVPYLRVANVQDGFLDLSEVKTIHVSATDVQRYKLEVGDLLLTEGGDPDKLGRGYVWNGEVKNCIHQNHVFRVRANRDKVLPMYLAGLVRTAYAKQYFLKAAKRTSNLASINMTQLKAFPVPVPPLDLQNLYAEHADRLLSATMHVQKSIDHAEKLFSTLLARAFSGELTAAWEREHADLIAAEVARLERRPRLALLALLAARQAVRTEPVGITSLMKYAFLAQMQGQALSQPAGRLYRFVPYHFGPFAQELYADLEVLAAEGWVTVERPEGDLTTPERTDIRLNPQRAAAVTAAVAELSADERADLTQVIAQYGDLAHNALLEAVYSQYPAYARKSKLRRRRS